MNTIANETARSGETHRADCGTPPKASTSCASTGAAPSGASTVKTIVSGALLTCIARNAQQLGHVRNLRRGSPAFESLRQLATRKLPEVEALIERAQAMRSWLLIATDCSCTSLDVCALFETNGDQSPAAEDTDPVS